MQQHKPRQFASVPAVRSKCPLLIGIAGPSGGGKTFSALRLAMGMQRVSGGDIHFIDTESGRALHYADKFKFKHVPFAPPYNPLSYLDAINYCRDQGPGPIIVDSTSHEHEGEGGVVDMHDSEVIRRAGNDWQKAERVKMLCWVEPKQQRRKLLNAIVQMNHNIIFCFRAKPKLKMVRGQEPVQLGYMPIGGDEFVFEMTVNALMLPGAGGAPTWNPQEEGEKAMVKLPEQFRKMLLDHKGPLDEGLGERMAQWAAGTSVNVIDEHRAVLVAASTADELAAAWTKIPAGLKKQLEGLKNERKEAILKPPVVTPPPQAEDDEYIPGIDDPAEEESRTKGGKRQQSAFGDHGEDASDPNRRK